MSLLGREIGFLRVGTQFPRSFREGERLKGTAKRPCENWQLELELELELESPHSLRELAQMASLLQPRRRYLVFVYTLATARIENNIQLG